MTLRLHAARRSRTQSRAQKGGSSRLALIIGGRGLMRYPHATRMDFRGLAAAVAAWLVLVLSAPAHADGPLGSNGSRIQTSDYTVDLSHGLVLDGSRPAGLGGVWTGGGIVGCGWRVWRGT